MTFQAVCAAALFALVSVAAAAELPEPVVLETSWVRLALSGDGTVSRLTEKATGASMLGSSTPLVSVRRNGVLIPATSAVAEGDVVRFGFGKPGVSATVRITPTRNALVFYVVQVTGDGLEELQFLTLTTEGLNRRGIWFPALSDERFVVAAVGLSDRVEVRHGRRGELVATVHSWSGMAGNGAALLALPRAGFAAAIRDLEKEYGLPSPTLDGTWAKTSRRARESYLFIDLTERNADRVIEYARRGGFTHVLVYGSTWSSSYGTYPINVANYPRGEASLAGVVAKCRQAGLRVGLHVLASFVSKRDALAAPVPDKRLLKDWESVLLEGIGPADPVFPADKTDGIALTGPYGAARDFVIGDEIISCSGQGKQGLLDCSRGVNGTQSSRHPAGEKIFHLSEKEGKYLVNLATPLREEVADRLAGLVNRLGIDMIYFDGGEINASTGPYWYWGGKLQESVWRKVNREILIQGSGITPRSWHLFARGTCDDYAALAPVAYLDAHKIAEYYNWYRDSFIPAELGWWGFLSAAPDRPATLPDEVDAYGVRMIALDAPVSLETTVADLQKNGRTGELLDLLRAYETIRLESRLPEDARKRLASGKWRLERPLEKQSFRSASSSSGLAQAPVNIAVGGAKKSEFGLLRLQVVPRAAPAAADGNLSLLPKDTPVVLELPPPGTPMPGALAGRVRLGRKGDSSLVSSGRNVDGDSVDLTNRRILSITLAVSGVPMTGGGQPPVLNVQLEGGDGMLRDHFIDLDFTGARTVLVLEPTAERTITELRPASSNYRFKSAIYSFPYNDVRRMNFRWMRAPAGGSFNVEVLSVEARAEVEAELSGGTVGINGTTIALPPVVKTGEYVEIEGRVMRHFDGRGMLLSHRSVPEYTREISEEKPLVLNSAAPAPVRFTLVTLDDKF